MSGIGSRNGGKRLLIVGDTPQFGRTISLILEPQNQKWSIRHTTYEGFRGMLSPRLFQETDLFVLDLWRTYPTGIRAEGIAVAEQLARQHAKSLVVSPLSIGRGEGTPGYWDIGSQHSLTQSCLLTMKEGSRSSAVLSRAVKERFSRFLTVPTGHKDSGITTDRTDTKH